MFRKYKILALLLSVLLVIFFAGCGGSKTSKSKGKKQASQVAKKVSAPATTEAASKSLTPVSLVDQEDIPVELRILSSEEFGRENPFIPLASSSKNVTKAKTDPEPSQNYLDPSERKYLPPPIPVAKKPELPDVRLTLVIDDGTAIFEENRSSKVLTVGETVGGMKIQEIRKDGALLIKDDKKYLASPNGKLSEIPSPAQQEQKQPEKVAKPVKAKKK